MIFKATKEIEEKLKAADLKCNVVEGDSSSMVVCGINGKYITYKIQFISRDDDNDVAIRAFDLVKFPEEKREDMIHFAHECTAKFRYAKFVANLNDNTMQLEYDMPVTCTNPGDIAVEMLLRIMRMLDDVGADMMRRVWA